MLPDSSQLALLNACLNASSALFLFLGFFAIKTKRVPLHRLCMVAAFTLSSLFLASYLTRYGVYGDTPFKGQGAIRTVYFALLISHILCAIVTLPLVLRTLYLAIKKDFTKHRQIARITFPLWSYVSVTGVIIYLMLYQL
ncbi:MAG: DUF420 domain-containing protein [Myxococcales bacterium]|nr:MAG: DUF420 domain-containing protein [Myxococcales bacterium]